jgi:hypothetical protein
MGAAIFSIASSSIATPHYLRLKRSIEAAQVDQCG